MQHLDEGTIHAWLDGALSSEEAASAQAHVTSCTRCADAVAEARGLIAASSRILTALDDVPSIKGARSAGDAAWGRRSLGTWLVRERIAAVVALVVAGGALTLVLTRDTQQATIADLASEPVRTFEVAAADSPTPPPVAAQDLRSEEVAAPPARVALTPAPTRGVASAREADAASAPSLLQQSPMITANAASAATRTDDSLRSVTVATAQRAEAREGSAEAAPSMVEKVAVGLGRRRATEESKRFSETRPVAPAAGAAVGAAAPAEGPRLVQEETMTESGRDVRRRIYRVDNLLVTLDERPLGAGFETARAAAANTPRSDSATPVLTAPMLTFIRWTDANGAEWTLTGAAPQERLERIRKLLGY